MAKKLKEKEITIADDRGAFAAFFRGESTTYHFDDIKSLRKLLSNERARILHTIKAKNPKSIYALTRLLKRDFKSVISDIKLLEKFGFIQMTAEKTGNRERLKPLLLTDSIKINIKI